MLGLKCFLRPSKQTLPVPKDPVLEKKIVLVNGQKMITLGASRGFFSGPQTPHTTGA